jgi:hypothetical protein
MYRSQIGFCVRNEKVTALRAVRLLWGQLGQAEFDQIIWEALKFVADPKSPVVGIKPPSLLMIAASDRFRVDSKAYFALLKCLTLNFAADKMYDDPPVDMFYTTGPVLTLAELIEETVASDIEFISLNNDLLGDRTIWQSYAVEFIQWLHAVVRIGQDEREIALNLVSYMKHIVWKLTQDVPLEAVEKTFLCNYYPGSPYTKDIAGWDSNFQAHENSNPLVPRDFASVVSHGEVGPFSKYFLLQSNRSIEQLTAAIIPGIGALPMNIGTIYPRGAYAEYHMTPLTTIAYDAQTEMMGFKQRLRSSKLPGAATQGSKDFLASLCTPSFPAGVKPLFPVFDGTTLPFDLPEVELKLRPPYDRLNPNDPFVGLTASWMSKWRGRRVSTFQGATVGDLLTDLAIDNETYGSKIPYVATIPEKAILFRGEPSIDERIINIGSLASSAVAPIMYTFYLQRRSAVETVEVDMRMFYARRGTTLVRPTGVEFLNPPLSMLYTKADAAVSFVASQIGLTIEEETANAPAITMAFNYAECSLFFNGRTPPLTGTLKNLVATSFGW